MNEGLSIDSYIAFMIFNPFNAPGSISVMLLLLSVLTNKKTNSLSKKSLKETIDAINVQQF